MSFFSTHRPRSSITIFTPFATSTSTPSFVRTIVVIFCTTRSPCALMNHPSFISGCFPPSKIKTRQVSVTSNPHCTCRFDIPGLLFIREATRASAGKAPWLEELSKTKRAWQPGWAASNVGIARSTIFNESTEIVENLRRGQR